MPDSRSRSRDFSDDKMNKFDERDSRGRNNGGADGVPNPPDDVPNPPDGEDEDNDFDWEEEMRKRDNEWKMEQANIYSCLVNLKKLATQMYKDFNGLYFATMHYDKIVDTLIRLKAWKDEESMKKYDSLTPQTLMVVYALKLSGYDPCYAHINRMLAMCDFSTNKSTAAENALRMLPFWLAYTLNGVGIFARATNEGRWWLAMSISGMLARVMGYALTHEWALPKGNTKERIAWVEKHVETAFRAVGLPTNWHASSTEANGGVKFKMGGSFTFDFNFLTEEMRKNILTLPVAVQQEPPRETVSGGVNVSGFEQ